MSGKARVMDPTKPLKDIRWEAFCRLIAEGQKQGQAAEKAGYNIPGAPSCATALLKRPLIQKRISFLSTASAKLAISTVGLSKGEVLKNLRSVIRIALGEDEVPGKSGENVPHIDLAAANRALELTGKELGMFIDRKILGLQDLRSASADELFSVLSEIDSMIGSKELTEGEPPSPNSETGPDHPQDMVVDHKDDSLDNH